MEIKTYFDEGTSTFTYLIWDEQSRHAAIIDPVLNLDYKSGHTGTESADLTIADLRQLELNLDYILETHAHADHISAAPYVKKLCGGQIGIGTKITLVQKTFKGIFNLPDLAIDGSQFDLLLDENSTLSLGELKIKVLNTPGHTPACVSYHIGDVIFIGDTFFAPNYGTARADFPGGNAGELYKSLQHLLSFPDETRLFLCHDYPEAGEKPQHVHTVAEQRNNIHLSSGESDKDFIQLREDRDSALDVPLLILPSIQVNINAGELPVPEDNGVAYLKLPLNTLAK